MKQKAVIVCPGRGTYNKAELGYLARHHARKWQTLDLFETERLAAGQTPILELDSAGRFVPDLHTRGERFRHLRQCPRAVGADRPGSARCGSGC